MTMSSKLTTFLMVSLVVLVCASTAVLVMDTRTDEFDRARARLDAAATALAAAGPAVPDDVQELGRLTGVDATLVRSGRVVSSTLPAGAGAEVVAGPAAGTGRVGGSEVVAVEAAPGVVLSLDSAPMVAAAAGAARVRLVAVLALCAVVLVAAWAIARRFARPLATVADGAERLAAGGWEEGTRVRGGGGEEVWRVASALNSMAAMLRTSRRDAARSREDRAGGLVRFGAMLEATHDRDAILGLTTEVSLRDLGASGAALHVVGPARNLLEVACVAGTCGELKVGSRIAVGQGLAGAAAAAGVAARTGPAGGSGSPRAVSPEPARDGVAAPLRAEGRIYGVLALYGRTDGRPYGDADLEVLAELARQAGVAVDNVSLHEEAERLAVQDSLTGLWNRRHFDRSVGPELERAARFSHPVGLVMIDADDFKHLNESHGHLGGDQVLAQVGKLIAAQTRAVDLPARYGGEEFVVMLPETDLDGALVVADKIRLSIAHHRFVLAGTGGAAPGSADVTVSVGVAAYPQHGETPGHLVAAADQALYEAKRLGKNRIQVAAAWTGPDVGSAGAVPQGRTPGARGADAQ